MRNLVILESPGKVKTVNAFLGNDYKVIASVGHIRDLPKSTLGVDTEHGFAAKYITIHGKSDTIASLKKEAKAADKVFLATDPDREGEAISWHIATVLGLDPSETNRVTFNEITKKAVEQGIGNPRPINMDLVNSQQARRILDRIVGYKLSPYLWKTIKSGLSAGRVQSVAARLIVEREEEISAFVPHEYWTITATLAGASHVELEAKYYGVGDEKTELADETDAKKVIDAVKDGKFTVTDVTVTEKTKSPEPPFITSSLLREASKRFGYRSSKIMRIAQELYEGVDLGEELGGAHGIITYMRTDSLRISDEAADWAKDYIVSEYGRDCYPQKRRVFKSGALTQDAHEAIRPSYAEFPPAKIKGRLTSEQFKIYKLIWDRFIASQMKNAEYRVMNADTECAGYRFRTSESMVTFKGFMSVYTEEEDSEKRTKLNKISKGDVLDCVSVTPKQNFTEPPAHYTEGSLVDVLKEKGIGRPSTYASTITTVVDRGYAERDKKILRSCPLGETVVELMKKNFKEIIDYRFTANMEKNLDDIALGNKTLEDVMTEFYGDFEKQLEEANLHLKDNKVKIPDEESDIICEKCGRKMVIKTGRYGKFAACPGFPECRNTKQLTPAKEPVAKEEPEKTDLKCEKCGGDLVIRNSRYGKFYACSNFPKCKFTKTIKEEIGVKCPVCGSEIVKSHGKKAGTVFYNCERYPECAFSMWDKPTNEKCPECGSMLAEKKNGTLVCTKEGCGYKK